MLSTDTRFLLEPQRCALSTEFLQAMTDNTRKHARFGVLLSGPAGAGKSAVGLLSFARCVAQGLPCVYIPDAGRWVDAAQADRGDEFFLQTFMHQNADLIIGDPLLRRALAPALAGGPLDSAAMKRLLDALVPRPGPCVGCIVDEVQLISAAIAAGQLPGAIPKLQHASAYFQHWQNWVNKHEFFVRMDIASAHGSREFELPGGDDARLRIVVPWLHEDVVEALSAVASPLAIASPAMRTRAFFIGGGILRLLYRIRAGLSAKEPIDEIERHIRATMLEQCHRWFAALSGVEQLGATQSMLSLVRGELCWDRVKGLYDDGIVARFSALGTFVLPVSLIASSVIIQVLAAHGRAHCHALSSFEAGEPRGLELERQLIEFLLPSGRLLPATSLDARKYPAVYACADISLTLSEIADISVSDLATLYIPLSKQFPCDAITVSARSTCVVVLWECSVADPRESDCVNKVMHWFEPGGLISKLRSTLPKHSIVLALCWDGDFVAGRRTSYKKLDLAAATASFAPDRPVTIAVLDRSSLRDLGVHT